MFIYRILFATLVITLIPKILLATESYFPSVSQQLQLIAHRAGKDDAPENTSFAINEALKNKADAIWITIQLSKDHIPVLYRPQDLSANTNAKGFVSEYSAAELKKLDAAYYFKPNDGYPYRNKDIGIPSLDDILMSYPETFFYLDLKSPDADPISMKNSLLQVLTKNKAFNRVRVYSTNKAFTEILSPEIATFATRDLTRQYLVETALNSNHCPTPLKEEYWHGFELYRKVKVVETFTLGEGVSEAVLAWSPEDIKCFKQKPQHIILFGIKTKEDLELANKLGVDGVMVDSPKYFSSLAH
ncbi:glycerophosphodiester phosphodiesterase family protein [Rodentibacter caecimuris]|uniref:glycerophosphodiester phosphodiesterase family protein n=1 Tax=Rodentibacter caecimuris TaxID=1796644 RepID=UPI00258E3767|nr:glycerophosphodiester phosphodiesterase family protein [Rodentibacter heylii]